MNFQLEHNQVPEILIVDDDASVVVSLRQVLREMGRIRFAGNGADALALVAETRPTLIVLDVELPDISGIEVCRKLKSQKSTADIPVLFITSHRESGFEEQVFAAGAADYITKPLNPVVVAARTKMQLKYRAAIDLLESQARIDSLTGLANRRQFDEVLRDELRRARREPAPISLMMIDVDEFKIYNDHFGHPAGDACLARVAEVLFSVARRPADLAARYGGEEFGIILPNTEQEGAQAIAESLLQDIESLGIDHGPGSTHARITISIGCSSLSREQALSFDRDQTALVEAADRALYESKEGGRNRSTFHQCPCALDYQVESSSDA